MNKKLHNVILLLLSGVLLTSCNSGLKKNTTDNNPKIGYYLEQYRPQFHFSPEYGWMNDPNGMVFYNGEYHLFYQYYPDSTVWGPMHWGHAVSKDLIRWEHLAVALYPDSLGFIFSGSAVADKDNTSGLGTKSVPPLVAIFTYHNPEYERKGNTNFQNQGIAFSINNGRTWTKYSGNPVLGNPGIRDFRDPKVIWHEGTRRWIMILAVHDRIRIYSASDLIHWTFESEFGYGTGAHGGVWECPDLFPLKYEVNGIVKWVMLVSINPGGPNGGSATQYFTGDFDGHRFVPDSANEKWIDWGTDNYAGVTWSGIPDTDGRRLFIGWMSNWKYATVVPTEIWRSAMTIPRELSLKNENGNFLIISKPVSELENLRKESKSIVSQSGIYSGDQLIQTDSIKLDQSELIFEFNLEETHTDSLEIILENNHGEKFITGYSFFTSQFYIDRTNSGDSDFSEGFSRISTAPYTAGKKMKIHLFLDASSAELFIDDGKLVMTSLCFPSEDFIRLKLSSKGGSTRLEKAEFYELDRIWP
jgi:fructan beta-fructosidase